jgi:hypothetical protein
MVIGEFVDIKGWKGIEGAREGESSRYKSVAEDREKVSGSNDGVEVENKRAGIAAVIRMLCHGLNNPHSRVLAWWLVHTREPVHKGARILDTFMSEGEK